MKPINMERAHEAQREQFTNFKSIFRTVIMSTFLFPVFPPLALAQSEEPKINAIYWSDGDSGRIDGRPFRLANIDAPETGGIGSRGGAKCELERERGYKAKEFIVELTRDAELKIQKEYGLDRYDRIVVDLSVNNMDIATLGEKAGYLSPWPHKGQKALTPKPKWCEPRSN